MVPVIVYAFSQSSNVRNFVAVKNFYTISSSYAIMIQRSDDNKV